MSIEKKVLNELNEKLINEKKRIEDELNRLGKPTGSPGDYKTKFNEIGRSVDENASEVEEYTDNLALENTLEKQLKEIDEALKETEDETYGICKNCNKEIDIERLRAYPAARTCIKCK
ncbi:RNA polymerase-binding transcription factor DksA [bacterium BMS3Abin15]|nr:RNA polymerase-binding transcription factor DksA [bacterium BMS3Abin15]HDH07542.1 hypothetical protein [Candidatus Moranbacteria bacterium]HDZ85002.1 hypothetical protein [Candidatus Moranbacteria bacterium]